LFEHYGRGPAEPNLYFKRFLHPERTSPPDFDIDFSCTDRDQKNYTEINGIQPRKNIF